MQNVEMSVKADKLTITVDLSKRFGASKSGKTQIIASTHGAATVPDRPDIKLGLNLYTKGA